MEWLRRLPSDPAEVSADDVTTVARMVQQAASTSDLRLLTGYFEPVWQHHDVLEQQHERRTRRCEAEAAKAVRTRAMEQLAVAVLTARVQPELPELRTKPPGPCAAQLPPPPITLPLASW